MLNGFIVKPVTPSRLLDAVLDALAGKQMFSNAQQEAAPRQSRLNGLQLLLVEDNPTNQIVASELLGNEGALVDIAPGGTFALAMLEQLPDKYDLVLMDIQMPDMDGYETTRRIRSKAAMLTLPIVAMTANAMQSDKQACLDAGMNDHVAKPFAIDTLVQTILKWSKTPVDLLRHLTRPVAPRSEEHRLAQRIEGLWPVQRHKRHGAPCGQQHGRFGRDIGHKHLL